MLLQIYPQNSWGSHWGILDWDEVQLHAHALQKLSKLDILATIVALGLVMWWVTWTNKKGRQICVYVHIYIYILISILLLILISIYIYNYTYITHFAYVFWSKRREYLFPSIQNPCAWTGTVDLLVGKAVCLGGRDLNIFNRLILMDGWQVRWYLWTCILTMHFDHAETALKQKETTMNLGSSFYPPKYIDIEWYRMI